MAAGVLWQLHKEKSVYEQTDVGRLICGLNAQLRFFITQASLSSRFIRLTDREYYNRSFPVIAIAFCAFFSAKGAFFPLCAAFCPEAPRDEKPGAQRKALHIEYFRGAVQM